MPSVGHQEIGTRETNSPSLGVEDFAELFGVPVAGLPDQCISRIDQKDFRYRVLSGAERDQVLLEVFKRIDSGEFTLAGREGKARWEKGWGENLQSFLEHDKDLTHLVPKYIRSLQPMRLNQEYVVPSDPDFELNWYEIFQQWLFTTYFKDVKVLYEFGCGSGINLPTLAQLYPEKRYYGLDWASPSVQIIDEMAREYGWDMHGALFDFFEPDYNLSIEEDSAVLTVGALEQTGTDYGAFLQYLLDSQVTLCVNIEPMVEWYDESNLVDYAAIRFHTKRNYLRGFHQKLQDLELAGKVEILKTKRSFLGSLYIEGYSQIIWKPIR